MVAQFIPVGDDSGLLWGGDANDPESALFKKIKNEGHYGKDPHPDAHGSGNNQGYYALTPSGIFLASSPATDADGVAKMLKEALAKWQKLPREQRLPAKAPAKNPAGRSRAEQNYPADGLVLSVNLRDLPRKEMSKDAKTYQWTWNQDYAWYTKDQAGGWVPATFAKDAKHQVPDAIVRRLARVTFIDNVRSITPPFNENEVEKAHLTATVIAVDGDVATLRYEGETRTSASGTWAVGQEPASKQTRGFDAKLLGKATYNMKEGKFTSFALVVLGTRWGGTVYNVRTDDLAPAPMGITLTLAGSTPAERVAPFAAAYGQ